MQTGRRRRTITPFAVRSIGFKPEDLETVDDAAKGLEQSLSGFVSTAAIKEAKRVLKRLKKNAA